MNALSFFAVYVFKVKN